MDIEDNVDINRRIEQPQNIVKSETTLYLLIALIIVFIIINLIIYSTLLWKRKKKAVGIKRKLGGILSYDGATDDDLKRSKQTTQNDGDDSYILDVVRKSNTYEIVKMESTPTDNRCMSRHLSTSTVDTHTKVCEWMSNTNMTRINDCKDDQQNGVNSKKSSPFSSLFSNESFKKPTVKVSVAVDATSLARGNSVLCQEPIEITKLKMDGRNIIICQDVEVADQELLSPQNSIDDPAINMSEIPGIFHQHSQSDPLKMHYDECDEKVTSFMANDNMEDINVTSRIEENLAISLTPEHQLMMIKRRNYPKVLPTSNGIIQNSPIMTADLSKTYKRNSLPPNSFINHNFAKQTPPIPPPRTVSTLDRKLFGKRNSHNFTTSPLMLAEDCTEEEEEPEITENTLIVGPLIPKLKSNQINNNDTLKRKAHNNNEFKTEHNEIADIIQKVDLTPLSGVFQSFEINSGLKLEPEAQRIDMPGSHHTEMVYTIDTDINHAKYAKDVIYAHVIKSSSKTRLSNVSSTSSTLSSSSSSTDTVRTELKNHHKK